jgi:hypothetical protein
MHSDGAGYDLRINIMMRDLSLLSFFYGLILIDINFFNLLLKLCNIYKLFFSLRDDFFPNLVYHHQKLRKVCFKSPRHALEMIDLTVNTSLRDQSSDQIPDITLHAANHRSNINLILTLLIYVSGLNIVKKFGE